MRLFWESESKVALAVVEEVSGGSVLRCPTVRIGWVRPGEIQKTQPVEHMRDNTTRTSKGTDACPRKQTENDDGYNSGGR